MPPIEAALPVAAQGFADGRIDVEAALMAASDRSNSRCGGFLYSAFAETFLAFRGKDFATR
jgi:hypothetical protein